MQHIGRSKSIAYDSVNKRVVVASTRGVLASLSATKGALMWRQVLEEKNNIDKMLLSGNGWFLNIQFCG